MYYRFLQKCCKQLTFLDASRCSFLDDNVLCQIAFCEDLRVLKLEMYCGNFDQLSKLTKLVTLDLKYTNVTDYALINILKSNVNLKHINISNFKVLYYQKYV